jgi:hypothetical protein
MFRRKEYGKSKIEKCPFCNLQSIYTNKQGFAVCKDHKDSILNDMKCVCGDYLDLRKSKYGMFFTCMNCGAMSQTKVFSINEVKDISEKKKVAKNENNNSQKQISKNILNKQKREVTIRSDDPLYFN